MSSSKRSKKQVVAVCGLVVGIPAIVIAANQIGSSTSSIDWSNSNLSKNHLFVGDGNFTNDSSSRHLSVGYGNVNYSDDNALIGTYLVNGGNQNGSNSSSLVAGQYNEHVPGAAFTVGTGYYSFYTGNFRRNSLVVKKDGTVESGPLTVEGSPVITKDSIGGAGVNSSTFGSGNSATHPHSFAAGVESKAHNDYATAFGRLSEAFGRGSFAAGYQAKAHGNRAFAGGSHTRAFGSYATAFGYNSEASGYGSFAGGEFTISKAKGATSFGIWNSFLREDGQQSTETLHEADPMLSVGNGTSAERKDAFTVYRNGNAKIEGNLSVGGTITLSQPQGDISMGVFGN